MTQNRELWKTCRILANKTRLSLLRHLMKGGERCVSDLAIQGSLSEVVASQHLRMLHEHGFLQLTRESKWVFYRAEVNPAQPFAKELFSPLKKQLVYRNSQEEKLIKIFTAFTHPRRIHILETAFHQRPRFEDLVSICDISPQSLHRHLNKLISRGFLIKKEALYKTIYPGTLLEKTILDTCLRKNITLHEV